MQKLLFILNESPYGTEKSFNALRLAVNLQEEHGKEVEIKVFCFGDSVLSGIAGQHPNEGSNVQQVMEILIAQAPLSDRISVLLQSVLILKVVQAYRSVGAPV